MQHQFAGGAIGRAPLAGSRFHELAAPVTEGAQALHALWSGLCLSQDPPCRDAFSMDRIAELGLLGRFFVLAPIEEATDWRFRLLGTKLVWLFGRDITALPFKTWFKAAEAKAWLDLFDRAARSRQPQSLKASLAFRGHAGELEMLLLPVLSPDRRQVWLVGAGFSSGEAVGWTDL